MSRTRSSLSAGTPFTSNGPIRIPRFTRDTPVLDNWTASGEDPVSEYTFTQIPVQISRKPALENVGEDVANYLSRTGGPTELDLPSSVTEIQDDGLSGQSHLCLPVSSPQFGLHSPVSMYNEMLTDDSTLPSEMSRQSSSSDALIGGFQMVQVNSNSPDYSDADDNLFAFSDLGHSGEEQTQLLLGAGGASQGSKYPPFNAAKAGYIFPPTSLHLESMQRSPSNESNSSSESNFSTSSSRSKTQLQRQNQLANSRPLAAKPTAGDSAMSREPSAQSMIRAPSDQGGEERLVQAIPKALYQRPSHPKVWCKKCDDYPDGFRGEHELRRHTDRQHKVMVKKWVCSEPRDGLSGPDHPEPINPLSKCKACSQLKKKYGAYYNAAAHLRRAHFNPKPKGRGKGAKNDRKSTEKRGGKGGGDWPSMVELKRWMDVVDEFVFENEQQQPEQDEESDGDYINIDYSEASMHLSDDTSPNPATLINTNFLTTDNHMLNAYTTPLMLNHSHDNLRTQNQNMHIDMHMPMHASSNIDFDMPNQNIDAESAMFFDLGVQNNVNVLLMDNNMNDAISLSPSFLSSNFDHHQQQQQQIHMQQQLGHSDEFDSLQLQYNM